MSEQTWQGDWPGRIQQRARALGFDAVSAYASARPTATLMELAAELGDDVAAIQVERMLRLEAVRTGDIDRFSRDLLARYLRERLPQGWRNHERFEFQRAWMFASWSTAMDQLIDDAARDRIWNFLEHADIPVGWLPAGADDLILTRNIRSDASGTHLRDGAVDES